MVSFGRDYVPKFVKNCHFGLCPVFFGFSQAIVSISNFIILYIVKILAETDVCSSNAQYFDEKKSSLLGPGNLFKKFK